MKFWLCQMCVLLDSMNQYLVELVELGSEFEEVETMNKNTTNILLIVLGLAVAAGLTFFALNSANSPKFLFVQQAQSGTFELTNNDNPDEYILALEHVWPETTYFSDRPQRISGTINNEEFLELDGMFSPNNPPNAAIVLSDAPSEEQDVIIVELMDPQYDPAAGRLIYTVKLINREVSAGLKNWGTRKDKFLPDNFSHVTLFIDDNFAMDINLTNSDVCHIDPSC